MKLGKWITTPVPKKAEKPFAWQSDTSKYCTREQTLPRGEGLLTVRCDFMADKTVKSAVLRITALGIWEAFCNGHTVLAADGGRDELMPLWTDYRHRVFEQEYPLDRWLNRDEKNLLVVRVSDGWWTGRISFGTYGLQSPALCAEIELTYEDGHTELIASDTDWKTTVAGPVMTADIWDGEYFDARVPDPAVNPDAAEWTDARLFTGFTGKIVPFEGEPVRVREYIAPLSALVWNGVDARDGAPLGVIHVLSKRVGDNCEGGKLKRGEHLLLDFGEDIVGRPSLAIRAKDGCTVRCIFAEMKNDSGDRARGNDGPDGSLYVQNYRTAMAKLEYIAAAPKGKSELNIFRPLHTFYGFRYLELTAEDDLEIVCITAETIGSTVEPAGSFTCSNAEVNRLFANIRRGMLGNYLSVPTDCPQRDERLGWTGDTQIFCGAGSYLADTLSFFRKWLADARDSQIGFDGSYPSVIPRLLVAEKNAAAWSDAGIIVPYTLLQMYGDLSLIEEHFDSMEAYMAFLAKRGTDGPGAIYGDWLSYEPTKREYISVCYYAYDASLMEKMARAIGRADRAEHYRGVFRDAVARFHTEYMKNGEITEKTQTGYLLPIRFGMLTPDEERTATARLREKLIANDYTLTTGFVGTGVLAQTLSQIGEDNLAYSLLLQTRDPSWLYSVRQGATTVWERWNSYTCERGFGDVSMNSFNHYAYGAVAEWLFAGVAGIRPDPECPGFLRSLSDNGGNGAQKCFILSPRPDTRTERELPAGQERITMAEATYHGIRSRWEYENGELVWRFTIPDGTAKIEFPLPAGHTTVELNGLTFTPADLGGSIRYGKLCFTLPAGSYTIR